MSEKLGYDCHAEHGFSVVAGVAEIGELTGDWLILFRWRDEQGRRCTRFIATVYDNAMASAEQTARQIIAALESQAAQ